MPNYFVNKNSLAGRGHEVHQQGCPYMPSGRDQVPLGFHDTSNTAIGSARLIYSNSCCCDHCLKTPE
ncbi:MAG: hypothetical protein COA74_01130 [Gammaproteobacteria bacterium]|nr:MAG: hypothetical protein COA74_01130 [Gammaproteobacteria bacterium]